MSIISVGVTHADSPLAIREQLSIATHQMPEALALARGRARELLLLSTCNRTEAIAHADDREDGAALVGLLADWGRLDSATVASVARVRQGPDAVSHALRVASGLDSLVLGEDQIQSQFRHALDAARAADTLGPVLDRLGAAALACGKRVRTFTGIGRHSVSLESLAVRTVEDALGDLAGRSTVVLGAGESGTLVARRLTAAGARIAIVSRSRDRAEALAAAVHGTAAGLAELSDALEPADAIFVCTSAPHPVLTRDYIAHRAALRGEAPLLCVDLGMPRAIAPDVVSLAGVRVVTLDDLTTAADAHRRARLEHVPAAEGIVESEVTRYLAWLRTRGAAAELAELDARAEQLACEEVARALDRLPQADDFTKHIIAELGHRLARKLTHEPKQMLKRRSDAGSAAHG